ncbi:MAG: polysaccharide biosynthesis tyrosine autokinase [Thermomicrobiales bacterium]|nr:polysaccharide biosynthesis tyrosine autokinase [Thermomicrobiales bacterium]
MDLTLHNLVAMGRRWWWLLLLAPLVAGSVAFFQVSRQQELYSASSTIEINPPSTGTDQYTYYDGSIVATYRELITTDGVLAPVIEKLDLPLTTNQLRAKISTAPIANTRLMRISVSDPNPETAAILANNVAAQFQTFAEDRSRELAGPYREALGQQIAETAGKIATTQQMIENLVQNEDINSPDVASQLNTLRTQLTDLQNTHRQLLVTANTMDLQEAGAQTGVVVVQEAEAPSAPYAPNKRLYTLLAILAGLCIGVGAVFLLEYLDNTTKVDTPYNELIGAPLMTTIPIVPSMTKLPHQLFILDQPMSPESESMRLLRANVEFAVANSDVKTLAVTSAGPSEGKSTVVANLAVAMSQAGYKVVVVDADMRRPAQQEAFNLSNERGLSTLLARSDVEWQSVARMNADLDLKVITSGPIPPNPGDLLKSPRFAALLGTLADEADMVIVDTPPALAVSDALVVADVATDVLLVARSGETRVDRLQAAVDALPETAHVIGVALNYQKRSRAESYYYYYGRDDSSSGSTPSSNGAGRSFGQKVRKLAPGNVNAEA